MKDYSKTLATYGAIAACVNNGVKNWDDIIECLESALHMAQFEKEKEKAK